MEHPMRSFGFSAFPVEVQQTVFMFLEPRDMIELLKSSPTIASSTRGWNFTLFHIFQLLDLYDWSVTRQRPPEAFNDPSWDLTPKIIHALKYELRQLLNKSNRPLPPGFCILDYHRIQLLYLDERTPNDDEIEDFIGEFYQTFDEVHRFCGYVAQFDHPERRVDRWTEIIPNVDIWMSLMLFWYAMDDIKRSVDVANCNGDDITQQWHKFRAHVKKIFGEEGKRLLDDSLSHNGIVLDKYRGAIAESNEDNLPQISRALVGFQNPVRLSAYAACMLAHGPKRALDFFRVDPNEIKYLMRLPHSVPFAWGEAWDNIKEFYQARLRAELERAAQRRARMADAAGEYNHYPRRAM